MKKHFAHVKEQHSLPLCAKMADKAKRSVAKDTWMKKKEFVDSYFEAWNHHDPEGIADHLLADGIFRDVPENVQNSPDELIVRLTDFFTHFRHRYELMGEIQKSPNAIAFQYRMYPCDNKQNNTVPLAYHGAEFMTLDGDAAITITDYYDIPVNPPVNKYAKSGLSDELLNRYKQRLNQIMRSREEYLKPDLTLPRLAEAVGCSVNILSQVINSGFGTSFFDYLNRYRIEHAKELLKRSDGHGCAILDVVFTVGFNSNSAFYSAFRKYVGMTPAQYRQQHH